MHALADRLEFVPPPTPGLLRALALAVLVHAFLLAALTWGVQWKRESVTVMAQAELWSELPQAAAPQLIEVAPEPAPVAAQAPVAAPVPELPSAADIALAQEKLRLKQEEQLELEKQRLAQLNQERLLEKKRQQEKRDKERQAAEDRKKSDLEKQRRQLLQAQEEARRIEAQRDKNLQRIAGLAGATGAPAATGKALQSSGLSSSYAGRVSARIKPNIVFTDDIVGNPLADVEVRAAPNGIILSRKLVKPSGVKAWDDAVLKAVDKTEKLPPDTDGQVPGSLIIGFRPKD
jgi:colicin import membrane protein